MKITFNFSIIDGHNALWFFGNSRKTYELLTPKYFTLSIITFSILILLVSGIAAIFSVALLEVLNVFFLSLYIFQNMYVQETSCFEPNHERTSLSSGFFIC